MASTISSTADSPCAATATLSLRTGPGTTAVILSQDGSSWSSILPGRPYGTGMPNGLAPRVPSSFLIEPILDIVTLRITCWLLAAGYWLLAAGCWLLVVGCWLLKHFRIT